MELSKNAKTLLMILGAVLVVATVYAIPAYLKSLEPAVCTVNGECQHELFANQLITYMPLVLLAGMVIGALAYSFLSERTASPQQFSREAMYQLLEEDERKIFSRIVEEKGKVTQSEISRIDGIGKVKAHRLVERMAKKGIIKKEGFGKTNVLRLPKQLRDLFAQ